MDKQRLLKAFATMSRIRQFELWMHEHIIRKDAPFVGIMHSQMGEEAYSTALISQLRQDDYMSTTYRSHAHTIARGMSLKGLAAEVYGKVTGVCKGRGGNMHAVDQDLNIIGGFGIIGAGLPATVGTAFAAKYKETDQIAVAFFGDGAVMQGAFHESMNLASMFQLPVLFVNNNNHWAMSTPAHYTFRTDTSTRYASAYAMPSCSCDGMDFFKAYECARDAIAYVRSGQGPYFIEFDCYRYHGQWEGDQQKYKDPSEAQDYIARDPIALLKEGASSSGLVTLKELAVIEERSATEVAEAFEFALASEPPQVKAMLDDIYADVY